MPVANPTTGYLMDASGGGVFAFGSAGFYGSEAGDSSSPVVGMAATPNGHGWLLGGNRRRNRLLLR